MFGYSIAKNLNQSDCIKLFPQIARMRYKRREFTVLTKLNYEGGEEIKTCEEFHAFNYLDFPPILLRGN